MNAPTPPLPAEPAMEKVAPDWITSSPHAPPVRPATQQRDTNLNAPTPPLPAEPATQNVAPDWITSSPHALPARPAMHERDTNLKHIDASTHGVGEA